MADVQVEDGFTRVANALLEAVCAADLPGRHLRVALAIMRLTYGFNRRVDWIGSTQLSGATGIADSHVRLVLRDLIRWGVVVVEEERSGNRRCIGIQKDFERWSIERTTRTVGGPTPRTVDGPTPMSGPQTVRPSDHQRSDPRTVDGPHATRTASGPTPRTVERPTLGPPAAPSKDSSPKTAEKDISSLRSEGVCEGEPSRVLVPVDDAPLDVDEVPQAPTKRGRSKSLPPPEWALAAAKDLAVATRRRWPGALIPESSVGWARKIAGVKAPQAEVLALLRWYVDPARDGPGGGIAPYTPEVRSGASFAEKWNQLVAARLRDGREVRRLSPGERILERTRRQVREILS